MEFKVTGFEGVDKALSELKKSTGKSVLRRVITDALKPVAETARRLAPVDEGDLRDSIVVSTTLNKSAKRNAPRLARGERSTGMTVYAGTGNRNAVPREFGTIRSPAHPFMRPAWDRGKEGVLTHIQDNLGSEIMKAAERAGRKNKGKS